jgi:hypothetical protein
MAGNMSTMSEIQWKPGDRVRSKSHPHLGPGFIVEVLGETMAVVRWDDPSRVHGPFTMTNLEPAQPESDGDG